MHRIFLPRISFFVLAVLVLSTAVLLGQPNSQPAEVTPSKCWFYPLGEVPTVIGTDATAILVGTNAGKVISLSREGKMLWSSELGGELSSNILPGDQGILVSTTSRSEGAIASNLRSLSKETGITNWGVRLPEAAKFFLSRHNGTAIIAAENGTIISIDAKTGQTVWKREIANGFVAEPYFGGSRMIIAASGKQIFTIALDSGEIVSMRKSEHSVTALAELAAAEIILGDDRGNVMPLNGSDKPLWKFKSGGEITELYSAGQSILAGSHDNFVYALSARNGDVEWKKRLSGRLLRAMNIGGRFLLTMSVEENAAILTNIANGKVAGQIVFAEGEFLTADPATLNGTIFLPTNRGVYAYSLNGCPDKKEGGPSNLPPTNLK